MLDVVCTTVLGALLVLDVLLGGLDVTDDSEVSPDYLLSFALVSCLFSALFLFFGVPGDSWARVILFVSVGFGGFSFLRAGSIIIAGKSGSPMLGSAFLAGASGAAASIALLVLAGAA